MFEGEYRSLCLDKFKGRLHIVARTFRSLQPEELLIKVHYAAITNSDMIFLSGGNDEVQISKFPITPGFEGCGEVVAAADSSNKHLIGRRVACIANLDQNGYFEGLWSEFYYSTKQNIMIFDSDKLIGYEHISSILKPLNAVGMFDTVKKSQSKSVLHNMTDSQIVKIFISLCQSENIQTVNLVNNYSHVKDLVNLGVANIIVTEDEDWQLECKKLCASLNTRIAFDCKGGDFTNSRDPSNTNTILNII